MRRVKVFLLSVAWPMLVATVFALLFRSVYEQNGMIDLPLAWILIGIPFGIRQVGLWLLPKHHDLSGTLAVFALNIFLGVVIGGFVLVYRVGAGLVRTMVDM